MTIFDSKEFTPEDAVKTLKVLAGLTNEITKLDPDGTPPGTLGLELLAVSQKLFEYARG